MKKLGWFMIIFSWVFATILFSILMVMSIIKGNSDGTRTAMIVLSCLISIPIYLLTTN